MSREDVIAFYNRVRSSEILSQEFNRMMGDNVALIAIVKLAEQEGFYFTTRELAEHILQTSSDKDRREPVPQNFLMKQKHHTVPNS